MFPPECRPDSLLRLDEDEMERTLQELTGEELEIAVTTRRRTTEDHRDHEYRLGRAALARVLARLGDGSDPFLVRFPHPAFSITHSGDVAVAVGLRSRSDALGVGVDLELRREVDPRTARYFLAGDEEPLPLDESIALLQLWTIKEAVFKADVHNAGMLLRDYRVCELSLDEVVLEGVAQRGARSFRFSSFRLPELLFSIALPERTSA